MPATLTYGPVPFVLATARTQLATRRRHARCAETHPVPPLKGLGEPCAASVSYRASVPAGHASCGVALSYRASSPDGEWLQSKIERNHSRTLGPDLGKVIKIPIECRVFGQDGIEERLAE